MLPLHRAASRLPTSVDELTRWLWVTTPADCGLRQQLESLFRSAGRELPVGAMADTEGAGRGMVASGLGAGMMRLDQAQEAERLGQGVIWPGWRGHTWLCWVGSDRDPGVPAALAVREAVEWAWAVAWSTGADAPALRSTKSTARAADAPLMAIGPPPQRGLI